MNIIAKHFDAYTKAQQKEMARLSEYIETSKIQVYKYRTGKSTPPPLKMKLIAKFYGASVDEVKQSFEKDRKIRKAQQKAMAAEQEAMERESGAGQTTMERASGAERKGVQCASGAERTTQTQSGLGGRTARQQRKEGAE